MTLIEQLQDGMAKLHEDTNVSAFTARIGEDSARIVCEKHAEQFWRKLLARQGAVIVEPNRREAGARFFADIGAAFGCEDEYRHGSD